MAQVIEEPLHGQLAKVVDLARRPQPYLGSHLQIVGAAPVEAQDARIARMQFMAGDRRVVEEGSDGPLPPGRIQPIRDANAMFIFSHNYRGTDRLQ